MPENTEAPEPQKTPEPAVAEVMLSQAELDDLKHKAEVSSQNFERAKKAELRVKELEGLSIGVPSDTGDDGLAALRSEVAELKQRDAQREVQSSYPVLKESWSEFEEFRSQDENKGMNLRTAAKAFLVEKGLLEPQRKGLEKPTGGPRVPVSSGLSAEEVKTLREQNPGKYRDMIKRGQLKIA